MSKPHIKLFIPGPVEVSPATFAALSQPLIGHRSGDFSALYKRLQPRLQKLFFTTDPVYLMTSSAWGAMEAAVRNVVHKGKVLCLGNGAFSDKWAEVAASCGKDAVALRFDWGTPVDPEAVRAKLREGGYEAITLVHNESSVGLMNPLKEIMAVVREFPEVISIVDTVSSFGALPIKKDELGIDIMLTGTQKALALPPGMALISVSERARTRAAGVPYRGYYFDLLEYHKAHLENLTPSTPAISLIYGLEYRCDQIDAEGLDARYARHAAMNTLARQWCQQHGFSLFPAEGFASVSMICAKNDRKIDLDALNKKLKSQYSMMINTGYGKLKGLTFRISSMGDETVASVQELLNNMEKLI
jgi:aspartate aminotransferase-like enzyme